MSTKKPDDWVHRQAGMSAQFSAMDKGKTLSIEFTTAWLLPGTDTWIVRIDGSMTDRGEYWWEHTEYLAIAGTEEHHTVDDATDEQIKQVGEEDTE